MRLVFVHGRAQQGRVVAQLQRVWVDALREGMRKAGLAWPADTEVRFPFYGDLLDILVAEVAAPLVDDVITRGATPDTSEREFRGEFLHELAAGAGISDAEIGRFYAGQPHERGPLNWEWVQSILEALDATPLGAAAIDTFTRDVYVYLTYGAVRQRIDQVVAADLAPGPCVVVAHSLGTVVGYNVLRHAPADVSVRKYVTVGSPLGVRAVQQRLERPLAMPSCARGWFNAMDERDVVALHPLDDRHFAITPPIENDRTIRNHTDNRHGIEGYLDDPEVARVIHQALVGG